MQENMKDGRCLSDVRGAQMNKERKLVMNNDSEYTFENYLVDEKNKIAFDICKSVAKEPGQDSYNPLFLYGGTGLGKTHLIRAIEHELLRNNSDINVIYMTAEEFTNDIISSIGGNRMEEFQNKYRNADVLIIEDIQEITGRERTQMEFFNTFNYLYQSKKQVIISSNRAPKDYVMLKEFESIDERISSRFMWGITLEILPPDYDTRVSILKNKAKSLGIDKMPDSVFKVIAELINSDVRELEGALNKMKAYYQYAKNPFNEMVIKSILKDFPLRKNTNIFGEV